MQSNGSSSELAPLSRHGSAAGLSWQTAAPGRAREMFMVRVQLGTLGHTAQKWEGPPGSLTQSINRLKNDTEE